MRPQDCKPIDPPAAQIRADESDPTLREVREKPGVLVVDDEHVVRIMGQLSLEQDGFHVWTASNGRDAIDLYHTHRERIAVVLFDVRMAGLDGLATLAALRALNPDVPACFMSGDLGAYKPEECRQSGVAHVIAKPFPLDQLANTLRLLADGVPADLPSTDRGCQG